MEEFEINFVLQKVIHELNYKIKAFIQSRINRGEKARKKDFFQEVKNNRIKFPISKDTYYKYNRALNKNSHFSIQTMLLDDFYNICQYTNVSADYYLGFIKTKRKEPSAARVQKDFGLSDKAMDILSKINNHKAEEKGELSADIVNYILEDKAFWEELNTKLPAYIAALIYNRDDTNTDATRYGTMKVFERLLDNISEKCINSDLPSSKVDQLAPFQFDII